MPEPSWEGIQGGSHPTLADTPRTQSEQCVCDAVQAVLRVKCGNMCVDLLQLGLTSLLAVQLSAFLRHKHSVSVPSMLIMQHRTVERIAAVLHTNVSVTPLVRRATLDKPEYSFPLSFEQEQDLSYTCPNYIPNTIFHYRNRCGYCTN